MPLLGRAKKRLATQTGSRALNADAAQSNTCADMSWTALGGLLSISVFICLGLTHSPPDTTSHRSEGGWEARKGEVCENC
jgi:hypothetical protein